MRYIKPLAVLLDAAASCAVCYAVTGTPWPAVALGLLFVAKQEAFNHYLQLGLKNRLRRAESG